MSEPLDLSKPMHLRAEMARAGIIPSQLGSYEDPERGWVSPTREPETQAAIRDFMTRLWEAALAAEATAKDGPVMVEGEHLGHRLRVSRSERGKVLVVCRTCRGTLLDDGPFEDEADRIIVAIENHS